MRRSKNSRSPSDTLRVDAMKAGRWSVCTADESRTFDTRGHATCDFATERGIKDLVAKVRPAQLAILDYYWLQGGETQNYYETRYGTNWPEKALFMLREWPTLRTVLLPIDTPIDKGTYSSMREQIKRVSGLGLSHFEISIDDGDLNPLVRHSKHVEAALYDPDNPRNAFAIEISPTARKAVIDQGRVHSKQSERVAAYCAIVRQGQEDDVRQWLRGSWGVE